MRRNRSLLQLSAIFVSFSLSFLPFELSSQGAVPDEEKGLFYYVVDRSGSIGADGLTEPIRKAITEHVDSLPEDMEVRLVFFSTKASEPKRWPEMTPEAKTDFANQFAQSFVPKGATRLYDTVGEVMADVRASRENYRFVTLLILADGENNWSRNYRSWTELEPGYEELIGRHDQTFIYLITLGFDPVDPPAEWVNHQMEPPGVQEIPIPEPLPEAEFTANPTHLKVGEPIQFNHVPEGGRATEFYWEFGDGNDSYDQNPEHYYGRDGSYTVKLRTTGPGGESEEVKSDFVQVVPVVALAADFRSSPEQLRVGETLTLQDASQGNPDDREWVVNGEVFSTEENPSLDVQDADEITVTLTVRRGEETDTRTRTFEVTPPPPPADFVMTPEEAEFGETVTFAANETQSDWQHRWTIDGAITLEGETAEWETDRDGLLHVVHLVEGPGGLSRSADRIFIHPPVEVVPSARFSATPRVFFVGEEVVFRADETDEEWIHEWVIGGEVVGEGAEWTWESDETGNQLVTHRIRIPERDQVFEESDEVHGRVHELVQVAFSVSRESGTYPMTVQFEDESVGEAVAYHWDFGDGNFSDERNPTHTYRSPGDYAVTLSITNPLGEVTSNVDSTILSVSPPMPMWQKVAIGGGVGLAVWVVFIVPVILRPLLAPEKGPKFVGIKTYALYLPARRGWTRFLWPKTAVTVGSGLGSDLRLPASNGKRENIALIERSPAASSYNIRPVRNHEIYKIERQTSLTHPEVEGKSTVTGWRILRDGDTYEIGGERLTWHQPKRAVAKRPKRAKQPLTNATTYQS